MLNCSTGSSNRNLSSALCCIQKQHKVYTWCKVLFIQQKWTTWLTSCAYLDCAALTVSMETLLHFFSFLLHNKVNSTHGECLSDYLSVSFLVSHQMDCVKECREDEFLCRNHAHCVPKRWRCDDVFDCVDHSDEENCDHGTQKLQFHLYFYVSHYYFLFITA